MKNYDETIQIVRRAGRITGCVSRQTNMSVLEIRRRLQTADRVTWSVVGEVAMLDLKERLGDDAHRVDFVVLSVEQALELHEYSASPDDVDYVRKVPDDFYTARWRMYEHPDLGEDD